MPNIKYFDIKLDKSQCNSYNAGDEIRGHCLVNIDGDLQLKNLDIAMICDGCVDYKENKYHNKTVTFLYQKFDLLKMAGTDQTIKGFIKIDFSFYIPTQGIPSSFEGKYGYIRYRIEAVIHKDWDRFRKEIAFTVTAPFNGSAPDFNEQLMKTVTKKSPIGDEFLELYSKLNKCIFIAGEEIPIYCHINKKLKNSLKLIISMHLKQNYFFTSKIKSKINCQEIIDYISPYETTYSNILSFMIPSNLKTMSFHSKLIEISYSIRVTIEILGTTDKLRIDLPIIVTIDSIRTEDNSYAARQLPPSYSDCQIFHRSATEDIFFPSTSLSNSLEFADHYNSDFMNYKLYSPAFVDLPPSYAEAVFGVNSNLLNENN